MGVALGVARAAAELRERQRSHELPTFTSGSCPCGGGCVEARDAEERDGETAEEAALIATKWKPPVAADAAVTDEMADVQEYNGESIEEATEMATGWKTPELLPAAATHQMVDLQELRNALSACQKVVAAQNNSAAD